MNFTIEQDKGATIFRPKEARLDSLISSELKAEFLILAQADVEKLIIDLTDVEYIDSGGLSALLLARRQMVGNDGDVRLVGVRPEVQSLLSLTQLDRVFPTYATIAEALAAPQLSLLTIPPPGARKLPTSEGILAVAGGTSPIPGVILGDEDFDDDEEEEDDDLLDIEEYDGDDDEFEDDDDDDDDDDEVVTEPVIVEEEDEYVEDVDDEDDEEEEDVVTA